LTRQARSEATRQKIIGAALELYDEIGYTATGMGDIIERAQITKGALYYHFESREAVATAIIEAGNAHLLAMFHAACESSAPAIESLIHSSFVVADQIAHSRLARKAAQLPHVLGPRPASGRVHAAWLAAMAAQVRRVAAEGDLRDDVDPKDAAEMLVASALGATLMATERSPGAERLLRTWRTLLPALVPDHAVAYLREFIEREPLRLAEPTSSVQ
jgi:AcrR family transcriptional regulator